MTPSQAIITGASAGLGYQYALQLARDPSLHLVLVARRTDRLERLAEEIASIRANQPQSAGHTVVTCDLRQFAERRRLIEQTQALELPVSWLVNNAGFGSIGRFAESELSTEIEMVEVNCIAPVHLTRALLPAMLEANQGTIINVASTAAYQPMPYMSTYGATKAFLLSLSVALANEVQASKLCVLAHCPGPTDTEFHLVVGLQEKLSFLPAVSAERVVAQALAAARSGRTIYINGPLNLFLAQLNRLFPKTFAASLIERALRRVGNRRA